jgi:tRNA G18 (ribose-2'-O)-methylase SpoU
VQTGLRQQNVDVLIVAPSDPHELGSLLRSVYAFGWRRVFLSDPHKVWFSKDPGVILKSRAAARRTKNLLAVVPAENLELPRYDAILVCDQDQEGLPVSRLRLPECRRLLLVFGSWGEAGDVGPPLTRVAVDHTGRAVRARFRHEGSILFSVISEMLGP